MGKSNLVDSDLALSSDFAACMQRILEELGCQTREYEWPDYWYFGDERQLITDAEEVRTQPEAHSSVQSQFNLFFHGLLVLQVEDASWPWVCV